MNRTPKSTDLAPEDAWFKSSHSSGAEGNCVEAADLAPEVGVRDSKKKEGPALVFPRSPWAAFVNGVRAGEFDVRA
ncbi:DUF397 domain-containing protein [Streptomyces sp. NPDC058451]|uniref:DUF397 domain-containing protein n=1 Tax=Streptomyces sp. NPDC058451 TaxID=3346506 RepID=UPI00364A979F